MNHAHVPDIEQLLTHAHWVRALARRLVDDEGRAADLEQEVWLSVLRTPPRPTRNVRGWLAAVVRNHSRQLARRERRASDHEYLVARGDAVEASSELVERAAVQRDLVSRVLTLDEPYRTVVLLRYFEDLETAVIAERLGVGDSTVRTQLVRAHDLLRQKLTKEYGDGRAWCVALLPLAELGGPHVASASGVESVASATPPRTLLLATSKPVLVVGVVLVATLVTIALRRESGSSAEMRVAARDESGLAAPADAERTREPVEREPRTIAPPADASRASGVSDAATSSTDETSLSGLVLDLHGVPRQGLQVACERRLSRSYDVKGAVSERTEPVAGLMPVLTDANGRYRFERAPERNSLRVADPALVYVGHGLRERDRERVDFVAPSIDIAGRVLAPDGTPLADAEVEFLFAVDAVTTLPFFVDEFWYFRQPSTRTDAEGSYVLTRAVGGGAGVLRVTAASHGPFATQAPAATTNHFDLVFPAPADGGRVVRGTTVDAAGSPLGGVKVELGGCAVQSDRRGRYELPVADWNLELYRASPLVASHAGHLPAVLEGFGALLGERDPRDDLVLTLGGAALAIRGRVLLEDGTPAYRCSVYLRDPTRVPGLSRTLELRSGMLACQTDEAGSFQLAGLASRAYRLQLVRHGDDVSFDSEPIAAGTDDVELRFSSAARREELAGRLFDSAGAPLVDAEVGLGVELTEGGEMGYVVARTVQTQSDGSFSFHGAPRERCVLHVRVRGEHVAFVPVPSSLPDTGNVFVLPRKVRFVIDARVTEGADSIDVRDADDRALPLALVGHDGVHRVEGRAKLGCAHDVVMQTTQDATELVLYAAEKELRRVDLRLTPDELTRVRL